MHGEPLDHAPAPEPQRLALRPSEAAKSLGIGERLLWSLTNQRLIPHVRLGEKRIVYPIHLLVEWLAKQAVGEPSEKTGRPGRATR